MECIISRRAQFSASHRYWLPEFDEEENQRLFGACTWFPGHGHNYVLYVSLIGEVDQYGMVENLSTVKRVIKREVTGQLDYSYLNDVWEEFQHTLPTTENLARVIWQRLAPYLPLANIQLFEYPQLSAQYQGNAMKASLTIRTHFSAAHRLALPELSLEENTKIYGKCARPHGHGHNYHLEVSVTGEIDTRTGMLVDLVALQEVVKNYVVEPFDHNFLNKDVPYFAQVVPTAENIVLHIAQLLRKPIEELGVDLDKVKLIESPNNSCEIYCCKSSQLHQGLRHQESVLARTN
ncbi:MAG: 6-pyruvoyl trahydropterin synthase family protein [cyanobacterium endosymbiont of Rhopalodia musculus]|uniref:6-pyruvoyl trahydropterin synthase family protein n=1 Tax=cyanobacterium endosymbiont of Epithemia clementina EcSB TaxID=3034674 RepID=UPI002480D04C|nr:6-carboxytetrahydropterin synthase [cyanobacterium endosymbiont of Epithemia clementina EcSB]WGT68360.1 6-carboxytetrahydropterin synthase [cyanobacterium endosymbiont of Epithemia clementina EcSB]